MKKSQGLESEGGGWRFQGVGQTSAIREWFDITRDFPRAQIHPNVAVVKPCQMPPSRQHDKLSPTLSGPDALDLRAVVLAMSLAWVSGLEGHLQGYLAHKKTPPPRTLQ